MKKSKKFAFYVFGMTYVQDLMPIFLKSVEMGHEAWFCFFDCVNKKRQFYYYEKEELIDFVKKICLVNSIPEEKIKISFFGLEEKIKFENEYDSIKPDVVFLQVCKHKYAQWLPKANSSKIINLAFHFDMTEKGSYYNIDLNVVAKEEYTSLYKNFKFPTKYFGNIKLDHMNYDTNKIKNYTLKTDKKFALFLARI